ncbi:BnaCnng03780D [Brassica napus]|uniref:BnaCnng03780D protein n=1 Tax=Brassica napus TaxID=3708 RepID=A0A078FBW5_BRANA|nr:BnaCnng03780D [Brassica napus]
MRRLKEHINPNSCFKKWVQEAISEAFLNRAKRHQMGDHRKECDEVVKYMSKLPPYLQGGEEESNVLNVGVLDWSRLEKWKQKCERRVSSTTTTTLATLPNASSHRIHRCKIGDHQVHAGSNLRKKHPFYGTTRHSKTASSRIFDQQDKIRHDNTSPSKRFSFSFGRLSRSFTFREDSSATDSMRFDGLACPSHQSSNTEEEKHNTHGGGSRVSPLRRLLDPLLMKPKVSTSSNQDEKKKQSRTRALLQLTIRNGIPLFQFVVDDDNLNNKSRSILGATMKSSDSSFKDEDSVKYCTFYSVNEVKKKKSGSWLIHGHKDKQQQQDRFVYNVIGEMRLCNSDITEHKPENISCVMRESVLVDETEEQVKGRKEVAAVVIKKGETTVIIPGGVHSIPEKGEPTTLIRRWRSGGCCDCGGWDVGCKLHVLSNNTLLHDFDQTFTLFDQQEESDKNTGPVLGMTELKTGMYRVEFGSFLSHLQAFFVCVTVVTCASEEETVSKTTAKTSSPFAPPLSPVGRA